MQASLVVQRQALHHRVAAEFGAQPVDRLLGRLAALAPRVDDVGWVGVGRRAEGRNADTDQAEAGALRFARQETAPSRARRNTLPGSAPVWAAFSTTTVPLTTTVVRSPLGYWCGSA